MDGEVNSKERKGPVTERDIAMAFLQQGKAMKYQQKFQAYSLVCQTNM